MKARVGNAPDSWGVWFPGEADQPPWQRFLDEVSAAGFGWIELGPYGYLPTDPAVLQPELERRGLSVSGAFVMAPLEGPWPALREAAERTGELLWRLPLHPEYRELVRGKDADLVNSSSKRKASTIYAAEFLREFTDGVPWAHLDIAGTAWDVGRAYVGTGPTGFGVRLLIDLIRASAD